MKNSWNTNIENLLIKWNYNIRELVKEHYKNGSKKRKLNIFISIINMICVSGTITSTLNSLLNESTMGLLLFQIILELIIVLCIGIDKYLQLENKAHSHYFTSREYLALSNMISSTLILERNERMDVPTILHSVQDQLKEIEMNAPEINYKVYNFMVTNSLIELTESTKSDTDEENYTKVNNNTSSDDSNTSDNDTDEEYSKQIDKKIGPEEHGLNEVCKFNEKFIQSKIPKNKNIRKEIQYQMDRFENNI